ncbi:MAG: FKBP-type peptidyl-prolyl cis-trans isomerase [Tannerella sp.]|jgi:FKBP-type peptidyl-prolyl cis-trans isomerase FklB|nr:FKBP-type peptidyl-prolyl cis-trans isomerase [Tannerella sp.]
MKRLSFIVVAITIICLLDACSNITHQSQLKNDVDTLSYFFGYSRANGIRDYLSTQAGVDTTYMDDFYKGFKDGIKKYSPKDAAYLEGQRIAMMINNQWIESLNHEIFLDDSTETLSRKAMLAGFYQGVRHHNPDFILNAQTISETKMHMVKESYRKKKYAESIAANEKFLSDNKAKEGVKVTPSGLQYKIITEGTGEIPVDNSTVKVNYRGTLIDGAEFDSSYKNEKPASFRVNQLIKGWSEALKLMPVGSKWEIYVPQEIAYGASEKNDNIPPFSTLIFELELLEIEK